MSTKSLKHLRLSNDFNCKLFSKKLYSNMVKISAHKCLLPSHEHEGENTFQEIEEMTCDPFLAISKDY